jgi:hypothetical protein
MKLLLTISSYLFFLLAMYSCKKCTTVYKDEYTGKKMLPFVQERAVMAAPSFFWDVSFEKDTIVFFNEEYAMPVVDSVPNDINNTISYFKKYIQPNMQTFRLTVFHEMFGDIDIPINEINEADLKVIMNNPTNAYGNMIIKVIHNFYVKSNGEY